MLFNEFHSSRLEAVSGTVSQEISSRLWNQCFFPVSSVQSWSPFALLRPVLLRYILVCYHLRLDRSVDTLLQDFRPECCTIIFLTFQTTRCGLLTLALLPNWRTSIYLLSVRYIRNSVVLWAGWSGNWIPVGARFFAPVQKGSGAHPGSHTMGLFRVKRSGRDLTTHPRLSPRIKKKHYTSTPPLVIRGLF